eukprot:767137-Hanusia_phi.AAC.3
MRGAASGGPDGQMATGREEKREGRGERGSGGGGDCQDRTGSAPCPALFSRRARQEGKWRVPNILRHEETLQKKSTPAKSSSYEEAPASRLEEFTTTKNEAEKLKAKWAEEKKREEEENARKAAEQEAARKAEEEAKAQQVNELNPSHLRSYYMLPGVCEASSSNEGNPFLSDIPRFPSGKDGETLISASRRLLRGKKQKKRLPSRLLNKKEFVK